MWLHYISELCEWGTWNWQTPNFWTINFCLDFDSSRFQMFHSPWLLSQKIKFSVSWKWSKLSEPFKINSECRNPNIRNPNYAEIQTFELPIFRGCMSMSEILTISASLDHFLLHIKWSRLVELKVVRIPNVRFDEPNEKVFRYRTFGLVRSVCSFRSVH